MIIKDADTSSQSIYIAVSKYRTLISDYHLLLAVGSLSAGIEQQVKYSKPAVCTLTLWRVEMKDPRLVF